MHKVLIVDDEAVVITQLEERLTSMGYDIVGSASSGTEAVEMARHLSPDIVLMDIVMPGRLDGIDASQIIKTELDIPAIFVTAYADDNFVERAKKVEPFGYIVKPFQEKEIKASIEIGLHKKEMERQLRKSKKNLQEQKVRLSLIIDGTSVPVFVVDKKHTVTHWNRACETITGIPADEVIGTTKQWSAFYSGARPVMADLIVNEAPEEEISRYYSDKYKRSVLIEDAYEAEDFFPDMGENGRWLFFTAAPLIDHHEKIIGAIETLQDFTDRRKAEEELKTSRYHIAMINKILRHDVINDLSVIRSALRLYGESGEERLLKEASGRVGKSVDLIRSMKELEIFISSRRDLKLYNMGSTIKEVMKSYPSIEFSIEGRGQVLANEALSSVIDNIIANAAIHGKADRLNIKIKKARDMYEIRIADNGIGIPDEIKGRIFEEDFVFGEDAHTGVGLYIVKNAIENYGGSVRVEDNTPKGTVFVLKLKGVN